MLARYWQWTSAGADSGVPFGPLRYRQWTSSTGGGAITSLPFGPLRFRAWTVGQDVPPPEPPPAVAYGGRPMRVRLPIQRRNDRRQRQDDEDLVVLLLR